MKALVSRRWLLAALVVSALVALVALGLDRLRSLHALDGGPLAAGDVNGDERVDITDAIYLLDFLFQGGPAPIEPPPISRPPSTGQTSCFDCSGNEITCSSSQFPGQDAAYAAGCPPAERFVDIGGGIVLDRCTGLEWEKMPADYDGDGSPDVGRWCQGLRYAEGLRLGGHDDWRVPNAAELATLLQLGGEAGWLPAELDGPVDAYWSSTTDLSDILRAWTVTFEGGVAVASRIKATGLSYTRAVRASTAN